MTDVTNFKKSDWERHLYHEATKWQHDVKGQVQWKGMPDAKDPNNGSKLKISDLEARLPSMLQQCLEQNQVPSEYIPEVTKFLAYVQKNEKFESKVISQLVFIRKITISLHDVFASFVNLSDSEQDSVVGKLEASVLQEFLPVLAKLMSQSAEEGSWDPVTEDRSKPFKLIDWLRHIYINCQKWINEQSGQVHWKTLAVSDPNNSKNGSRMKMEELKASLRDIVPRCLEGHIMPKKYEVELGIFNSNIKIDGAVSKSLELEEKLRKVAGKMEDVIASLASVYDEMTTTLEPRKMALIKHGAKLLEKVVRNKLNRDVVPAISDMPIGDILDPILEPVDSFDDDVDDGTDLMMHILDQAGEGDALATSSDLVSEPILNSSPEPSSEISSYVSDDLGICSPGFMASPCEPVLSGPFAFEMGSVASPHDHCGHLSDDSGINSPESQNWEDEEDLDCNIDFSDLDFDNLPDVSPYMSDSEPNSENTDDLLKSLIIPDSQCLKRKRSFDDEIPVAKKARP